MGSKSTTACFPSAGSSNQSSSQYRHHLLLSFCRCRAQESAGRCGEVRAPVKWRYRGATRAHRGPRLKSEWQAAEAIKIELLSRAARELLEQTGVQATFSLTRTRARTHKRTHKRAHTCTHTHTSPALTRGRVVLQGTPSSTSVSTLWLRTHDSNVINQTRRRDGVKAETAPVAADPPQKRSVVTRVIF